jgi:hypothetical protein
LMTSIRLPSSSDCTGTLPGRSRHIPSCKEKQLPARSANYSLSQLFDALPLLSVPDFLSHLLAAD